MASHGCSYTFQYTSQHGPIAIYLANKENKKMIILILAFVFVQLILPMGTCGVNQYHNSHHEVSSIAGYGHILSKSQIHNMRTRQEYSGNKFGWNDKYNTNPSTAAHSLNNHRGSNTNNGKFSSYLFFLLVYRKSH